MYFNVPTSLPVLLLLLVFIHISVIGLTLTPTLTFYATHGCIIIQEAQKWQSIYFFGLLRARNKHEAIIQTKMFSWPADLKRISIQTSDKSIASATSFKIDILVGNTDRILLLTGLLLHILFYQNPLIPAHFYEHILLTNTFHCV